MVKQSSLVLIWCPKMSVPIYQIRKAIGDPRRQNTFFFSYFTQSLIVDCLLWLLPYAFLLFTLSTLSSLFRFSVPNSRSFSSSQFTSRSDYRFHHTRIALESLRWYRSNRTLSTQSSTVAEIWRRYTDVHTSSKPYVQSERLSQYLLRVPRIIDWRWRLSTHAR